MGIKFIDQRARRQLDQLLIGGMAKEFSQRPQVQPQDKESEFKDVVRQRFGLPTSDTPDVTTLF